MYSFILNSDNWKCKFGPVVMLVARSLMYGECLKYPDISKYNQQGNPLGKRKHELIFI